MLKQKPEVEIVLIESEITTLDITDGGSLPPLIMRVCDNSQS